jgi:hypothetical protein
MKSNKLCILLSFLVLITGNTFSQQKWKQHTKPSTPSIIAIPDSVCPGDIALLYISGIDSATYLWSTGATTDSIYVTPSTATTYTAVITKGINVYREVVTINVYPQITGTIVAQFDSICPQTNDLLAVSGSGGNVTYKWSTGATTSTIVVTPFATTTYTATIYGKCDSVVKTITVTVIPFRTPVITGKTFVCKGNKDTLYVSGGVSYSWSNGSSQSVYYTGPINADSTIYVTAYNNLGCAVTDSFKVIVEICSGIDEIQGNNQFVVFPNPGNGIFTLSNVPEKCNIEIYNVLGARVYNHALNLDSGGQDNYIINLTDEPSGVYFYRFLNENGSLIGEGKIIIE